MNSSFTKNSEVLFCSVEDTDRDSEKPQNFLIDSF